VEDIIYPRIVFLDYHGVLTDLSSESTKSPPHLKFLTQDALAALHCLFSYDLYIISNQPGVAFGHFSESDLEISVRRFISDLKEIGITIKEFFYCPHHPEATNLTFRINCQCRKPNPSSIHKVLSTIPTDKSCCILVGDTLETDITCALAAGIGSVLLSPNEINYSGGIIPNYICSSLIEAVPFIHQFLN
jgi:histidinol-phosphate phosphatase family protein